MTRFDTDSLILDQLDVLRAWREGDTSHIRVRLQPDVKERVTARVAELERRLAAAPAPTAPPAMPAPPGMAMPPGPTQVPGTAMPPGPTMSPGMTMAPPVGPPGAVLPPPPGAAPVPPPRPAKCAATR